MADLTGPNPDEINGEVAHDAVDSGNPIKIGGYAKTAAPTAVSADGDRVNAWFGLRGQLATMLVDSAGAAIATGVQYIEDAALGAVGSGQGTLIIGRASAAAPTAVSADADAVAPWFLRSGQQVVALASGTALIGGDATGGLHAQGAIANDGVDSGNPLKIGGYASTAIPTAVSADADRVNAWYGRNGQAVGTLVDFAGGAAVLAGGATVTAATQPVVMLGIRNAAGVASVLFGAADNADALGSSSVGYTLRTVAFGFAFNGSTYDRLRTAPGVTGALAIGGLTASDAAIAAAPVTIGGRASTAVPTAMSADGDVVDARFLRTGALTVHVVDAAGAAASLGGGTQYVGDAAATATPTGTIAMGLANAAAPADVSANNDAVAAWYLRSGAQAMVLTAAGALIGGDVTNGLDVDVTRVTGTVTVDSELPAAAALADATANPTTPLVGSAALVYNGTTWDRLRGALSDAQAAGGLPGAALMIYNGGGWDRARSGGVQGMLGVSGATASDAVLAAQPVTIGGRASTAVPTAMSADGDVVDARFLRTGALTVHAVDAAGVALTTAATALGDTVANPTVGGMAAFGMVYEPVDADWTRMRAISGDAQIQDGILASGLMGYNGTTYDRLRVAVTADNLALGIGLNVNAVSLGYDGTNTDLLRTIPALDAAPNVDTGILAVGAGPGWDRKLNPTGVSATSTASVVAVVVDGAEALLFYVTTIGVTPGSMILQTSGDDATWVTADAVYKIGTGWIVGSFVPAVDDQYLVFPQGARQVRYKVNAVYASGTATVKVTGILSAALGRFAGDVAHDAVDSGYPVKVGGYAKGAAPTSVSDGDRVNAWFGVNGAQRVGSIGSGLVATTQTNISNSAATIIAARTGRRRVIITNRQLAAIFVGPATVTTANGFQVDPGGTLITEETVLLQAITAAASGATEKVHVYEEYDV